MQRFVSDSLVVLHFSRAFTLVGAWGGLCSPQGNAAPPGKHIRGPQKGNIPFHYSTSMTWSSEIFFFVFRIFIICRHSLPLPLYPARSPVGYDKSSGASLHFVLVRSVFVPATPGSWSLQGPQPRSHLALRNKKKRKRLWTCFYSHCTVNCKHPCMDCFFKVTCSIWCGSDIGGEHLDTRFLVSVLWQAL